MGCTSSTVVDEDLNEVKSLLQEGKIGDFDTKYSTGRLLGQGGFAKVKAVRRREDKERLAVKILNPRSSSRHGSKSAELTAEAAVARKEAVTEVATWAAVSGHRHVVQLVGAMAERQTMFLVMERCEASILEKMASDPKFWGLESTRILREMLLGVQACHEAGVVHRDIKPDNFLVSADGSVKLCDFGLAAKVPSYGQLRGAFGTVPFMSPEMLKGSGYGRATDVWSYGNTAYLLCFGEFAHIPERPTRESMKKAILAGATPRHLEKESGAAVFLKTLLVRCPVNRSTAGEALGHSFLSDEVAAAPSKLELAKLCGNDSSSEAASTSVGQEDSELESPDSCRRESVPASWSGQASSRRSSSSSSKPSKASSRGSRTSSRGVQALPGTPSQASSRDVHQL